MATKIAATTTAANVWEMWRWRTNEPIDQAIL